jgi:uncharacterized protein (DUF2267 family)
MRPRDADPKPDANPESLPGRDGVLEEIGRSENLPAAITPEDALTAVMCELEATLGDQGAQRLQRELPGSIRKFVSRANDTPTSAARPANAREFLQRISQQLDIGPTEAEEVTHTVFHAMHRLMSVGEVQGLARELPEDMRAIWAAGDDRGAAIRGSRVD